MSKKQKLLLALNALIFLAFFIIFQNKEYSYDSLEYAFNAKIGTNIFHPHHLLYNACSYLLCQAFGGKFEPLALLSIANAVIIAIVFLLIAKILIKKDFSFNRSILYANLFAVSSGALYIASSVEVYASTMLFQVLALFIIANWKSEKRDWVDVFLLALTASLASLFHQTAVFIIPCLAYYLWRENKKALQPIVFMLFCAAMILIPYYLCASYYGYHGVGKTIQWSLYYLKLPEYGGGALGKIDLSSFGRAFGGIMQTIFSFSIDLTYYQKLGILFPTGVVFALFFIIAALSAIYKRIYSRIKSKKYLKKYDNFKTIVLALAIINSIFAFWWEPNNFEFWLLSSPFWILFFAMKTDSIASENNAKPAKSASSIKEKINKAMSGEYATMQFAIVALLIANFCLKIYPASTLENNGIYQISHKLAHYLPDEKAVVISNIIELKQYLKYFENKDVELESLTRINYLFDSQKDQAKLDYKNLLLNFLDNRDLILLENELYPSFDKLSYYKMWGKEDYQTFYKDFIKMSIPLDYYEMNGKKCRIFLIPRKNYG